MWLPSDMWSDMSFGGRLLSSGQMFFGQLFFGELFFGQLFLGQLFLGQFQGGC